MHTIDNVDGLRNPRTPNAGAIADKFGDDTQFEITVIADNPLSSGNYKLARNPESETTIASERERLEGHARKVGYSGIVQIADYVNGECVTFRV